MSKRLIEYYIDEQDVKEYEALKANTPKEMDDRCVLGLHSLPNDICYAAVRRLHAIKTAGRELTEEEIRGLPGCPWAVQHQKSHYCFFKFMRDYIGSQAPSEQEMAHMMKCSVEDVSKAEKSAMSKFKSSSMIEGLKQHFDSCEIVNAKEVDASYTIIK